MPTGIENAASRSCLYVDGGQTCMTQCMVGSGTVPSHESLTCFGDILMPSSFTCDAMYVMIESGTCDHHIVTLDDCSYAASTLGLSSTVATEDGQSGAEVIPPFCYFDGDALMFNADGTNTGDCTNTSICLCQLTKAPGVCSPPTGIESAAGRSCSQALVPSGGTCTPQCREGLRLLPSYDSLTCSAGTLSPSSFTCDAMYVTQNNGTCEHHIVTMSDCSEAASSLGLSDSSAIDDGQSAAVGTPPYCYFDGASLLFNADGTNVGDCTSSDTCLCQLTAAEGWCAMPTGIENAASRSCLYVDGGQTCMTQCMVGSGTLPSLDSLTCADGTLIPSSFTCDAMYVMIESGTCDHHIVTLDDCSYAASTLGLSSTVATEDGQSGAEVIPPFCYFDGDALMFNADGTNTGDCTNTSICLCQLTLAPGVCSPPTGIESAAGRSCSQALVPSGGTCTPQCREGLGLLPSYDSLTCSAGTLSPSSFTCDAMYVTQNNGTCEHHIVTMSDCSKAASSLGLSDVLATDDGLNQAHWNPPFCYFDGAALLFNENGTNTADCSNWNTCLCRLTAAPGWCAVPKGVQNADDRSCRFLASGQTCTTQCMVGSGTVPSSVSLTCADGTLMPSSYTCDAMYVMMESGTCDHHIITLDDCSDAASTLGLSSTVATEDGQSGAEVIPPFCYFDGDALMFNVNGTNTGDCTNTSICLCQLEAAEGVCSPPTGIADADNRSCSQALVPSGGTCTPQCREGMPSHDALICCAGTFIPSSFTCDPRAASAAASLLAFSTFLLAGLPLFLGL